MCLSATEVSGILLDQTIAQVVIVTIKLDWVVGSTTEDNDADNRVFVS